MTTKHVSPLFVVTETKRGYTLEWHIGDFRNPAAFLYWALGYDARYEMHRHHEPKIAWCEFVTVSGAIGEYKRGLLWNYQILREFGTGTHSLTHHGLDGMPKDFFENLVRDEPLFEINAFKGSFMLSLNEWLTYFHSGRNSQQLIDLGIENVRS